MYEKPLINSGRRNSWAAPPIMVKGKKASRLLLVEILRCVSPPKRVLVLGQPCYLPEATALQPPSASGRDCCPGNRARGLWDSADQRRIRVAWPASARSHTGPIVRTGFPLVALAFWPFYFPFMTASIESHQLKRRIFAHRIGRDRLVLDPVPSHCFGRRIGDGNSDRRPLNPIRLLSTARLLLRSENPSANHLLSLCGFTAGVGLRLVGANGGDSFRGIGSRRGHCLRLRFVSVWCFFAAALSAYLCWKFATIERIARSHERIATPSRPFESA